MGYIIKLRDIMGLMRPDQLVKIIHNKEVIFEGLIESHYNNNKFKSFNVNLIFASGHYLIIRLDDELVY
jgi:hypothetical protein